MDIRYRRTIRLGSSLRGTITLETPELHDRCSSDADVGHWRKQCRIFRDRCDSPPALAVPEWRPVDGARATQAQGFGFRTSRCSTSADRLESDELHVPGD